LEQLIPAVAGALWARQPVVPLPENVDVFTGLYQFVDPVFGTTLFEIYVQNEVLYAAFTDGKLAFSAMNLTQVDEYALQAINTYQTACRWEDDGTNYEILYFTPDKNNQYCTSIEFMATTYVFVSKKCPQC